NDDIENEKRDISRKRKVTEETHEAFLAIKIRNTNEEREARLMAEEGTQRAYVHKKYLLRKAKETSQ
ncbi:11675_t:CDS:2, partial [Funneliformis mosseae]